MHWLTNFRIASLSLLGAVCFTACTETTAPSTMDSAVDVAYATLVADIADCAKQLKTCTDGSADDAADASCRDQFAGCREAAGKQSVNQLASAVRSCTSQHNACVHSAPHGEAGSCNNELRSCLRAAHPDDRDDDDAGADADESKGTRSDCLDELHPCVQAAGPANMCAEQVRVCLVDSLPSAGEVLPEDDMDEDGEADESADAPGSGKPRNDGGTGHGKSASAADGGTHGQGANSAARMCVDTMGTCIDSGTAARDCAKSLKECRAAARP